MEGTLKKVNLALTALLLALTAVACGEYDRGYDVTSQGRQIQRRIRAS